MCVHNYNAYLSALRAEQVAQDNYNVCLEEINGLNAYKEYFAQLHDLLKDFRGYANMYAAALAYVAMCLKYVIVNDLPFDKGACDAAVKAINEASLDVGKLLEELETVQQNVETELVNKETEKGNLKTAWDNATAARIAAEAIKDTDCILCLPEPNWCGGGGGGSGGCFISGTKVHTNKGLINIEEIKVGDMVLSYDETNEILSFNKVLELLIHEDNTEDLYKIKIEDEIIEVTECHRFYAIKENDIGEWTRADKLKIGYKLMLSNCQTYEIKEISSEKHRGTVYNFNVENNHNYFVSSKGILVHNKKSAT